VLRSLSVPFFLLVFAALPAAAQTTDPRSPPPASQAQNPPAAADAKKPKKVLTNEDLSNSTGKISVVGNGQNNPGNKPKAAAPRTANPQYVASVRNQIEKLLKQIVDVDKQITDLKNFKAGEPSTNSSGVQLDKRYEREPVEVQIRALQDKRKDLQAKVDALYDEARKKGVESGELP
jgi:chaperonin cofactor prefoldin